MALRSGNEKVVLVLADGRLVLDNFDTVRNEAAMWRLKMGRAGRLLVFDPALVERIERFLLERASA